MKKMLAYHLAHNSRSEPSAFPKSILMSVLSSFCRKSWNALNSFPITHEQHYKLTFRPRVSFFPF